MSKSTPGPWKIVRCSEGDRKDVDTIQAGTIRVVEPGGIWGRSIPECDANAALIAAAPDLLAALKEAETVIRWAAQESAGRVKAEVVGGWIHHADKARAAVAKAEGLEA